MYSCPECGAPTQAYVSMFACDECCWFAQRRVFDVDLVSVGGELSMPITSAR